MVFLHAHVVQIKVSSQFKLHFQTTMYPMLDCFSAPNEFKNSNPFFSWVWKKKVCKRVALCGILYSYVEHLVWNQVGDWWRTWAKYTLCFDLISSFLMADWIGVTVYRKLVSITPNGSPDEVLIRISMWFTLFASVWKLVSMLKRSWQSIRFNMKTCRGIPLVCQMCLVCVNKISLKIKTWEISIFNRYSFFSDEHYLFLQK